MRKRKAVRLLVIALSLIMISAILFTGCKKNENVPTEGQQSTESNETTTTQETSEEDSNLVGNIYKTGLPIVKDKITVKIAVLRHDLSKKPIEEKEYTQYLEENTNIHVDWQEISSQTLDEKVNIMFAGGDLPDALMSCVSDSILLNNYDSGLLLPLNDLLENWAPNLNKLLTSYYMQQLLLPDGKLYSTPSGAMAPWLTFDTQPFINKSWLDSLGLEIPETTQDFHNVLKAFKDNDVNGNGNPDDEIPLSFVGVSNLRMLLGSFGIACNDNYLKVNNGEVVFVPATNNFKQAMEYFHNLYADELIDPESFTQNINQLRAKGKNEEAPLLGSFIQFLDDITVGNVYWNQYSLILPLEGPNGDQEYQQVILKPSHGLVITSNSEYPEAIIRWVDYMHEDIYNMVANTYGLESQGIWSKVEGNKYRINADKVPEGTNLGEWWQTEAWGNATIAFSPADYTKNYYVIDDRTKRKLDFCTEYESYQLDELIPSVMIEQDINQELSSIQVELAVLVEDFIAKSIIEGSYDTGWDTFLNNLKKAKYERYVELYQEIYDRYN
jgi:putative aldouronate transport system substrate-binding protein